MWDGEREEGGDVFRGEVERERERDWHNVTSNPVMNLSIRNSRLQPRSAG